MAIPEGLLVNYLLRKRNPSPFLQTFIVQTLYDASGGSGEIIGKLQQSPPDYILYLHRAPEFPGSAFQIRGSAGFANASLEWIDAHYSEVDRIGPRSADFGELLYVLLRKVAP